MRSHNYVFGVLAGSVCGSYHGNVIKKRCPRSHRGIRLLHYVNKHTRRQTGPRDWLGGVRDDGRKKKRRTSANEYGREN